MGFDRRVVVALVAITLVLLPAAVLRALCAGHSCDEPDAGATDLPFCSLPDEQRKAIVAGFREGRSPDILTATDSVATTQVPILFFGDGFGDAELGPGIGLDQIAPTLAPAIDFDRPHPKVRSGTPIPTAPTGTGARLVLVIAVKGAGGPDFDTRTWSEIPILGSDIAVTAEGSTNALPIDPTAALTTIGTGGLPRQHGVTGRLIRDDSGELVKAWGKGAPVSVIATLADDLDEATRQKARVALVGNTPADRGLVGGNWYIEHDRDDLRYERSIVAQIDAVRDILSSGYGTDEVPDLVAVALKGPERDVDMAIVRLLDLANDASKDRLIGVIAGTGASEDQQVEVAEIERSIPGPRKLIEGTVPGGFFVDQDVLASTETTEDEMIDAIEETGKYSDVFAAITVSFARFC